MSTAIEKKIENFQQLDNTNKNKPLYNYSLLGPDEQLILENFTSGASTQVAAYAAVRGKDHERATRATITGIAHQFFARADVQLALTELRSYIRGQHAELREKLIAELQESAAFDPYEAYKQVRVPTTNEDGSPGEHVFYRVRDVADMPAYVRRRIVKWQETKYGVNVQFVDRLKAASMLIDLLGIGQQTPGMTINIDLSQQGRNESGESETIDVTPQESTQGAANAGVDVVIDLEESELPPA